MTYALTTPLPFGAGTSLCPPDPPPCTCFGDRIDPGCPCCGGLDLPDCVGGSPDDVPVGVALFPVATPAVGEPLNDARRLLDEVARTHEHSPFFSLDSLRRARAALDRVETEIRKQLT